jgi:hypothetical protein
LSEGQTGNLSGVEVFDGDAFGGSLGTAAEFGVAACDDDAGGVGDAEGFGSFVVEAQGDAEGAAGEAIDAEELTGGLCVGLGAVPPFDDFLGLFVRTGAGFGFGGADAFEGFVLDAGEFLALGFGDAAALGFFGVGTLGAGGEADVAETVAFGLRGGGAFGGEPHFGGFGVEFDGFESFGGGRPEADFAGGEFGGFAEALGFVGLLFFEGCELLVGLRPAGVEAPGFFEGFLGVDLGEGASALGFL